MVGGAFPRAMLGDSGMDNRCDAMLAVARNADPPPCATCGAGVNSGESFRVEF